MLCGYILLTGFIISPSVEIVDTDWVEPVIIWLTVCMPTGSGKSTLFRHLLEILEKVKKEANVTEMDPAWVLGDSSFEKMGSLMSENAGRLLGIYDEMSTFLTQINLYSGRNLSESHQLALFLQLFNGHPWRRDTSKHHHCID